MRSELFRNMIKILQCIQVFNILSKASD